MKRFMPKVLIMRSGISSGNILFDELNVLINGLEFSSLQGPLRVTFTSGRAGSYSQLVPRAKETLSRLAVAKFSSEKHSEFRKDHHPFCSVCGRRDRVSNRVSVCASCKVLYKFLL